MAKKNQVECTACHLLPVSKFEQIGTGWIRRDEGKQGYSWVLGKGDYSRDTMGIHGNSEGSEYNGDCVHCFFGHAHSIKLHEYTLTMKQLRGA